MQSFCENNVGEVIAREVEVALTRDHEGTLARRLRDLRESTWPEQYLTQVDLARALSSERTVAAPTLSSWESLTYPKTPPAGRISAYARFFCTERSLDGGPHLIPEDQLTPVEAKRFHDLESELLRLAKAEHQSVQRILQFDAGPVVVICPTTPHGLQAPPADEHDPGFTRMRQYGELDALIELYGHLRAENPTLDVFHRLIGNAVSDDFSSHLILLGGLGCNQVTRRLQRAISQVPIKQTEVDELRTSQIFCVETPGGTQLFSPEYADLGDGKELIADIGYIAHLRNPFKADRTLTIFNGIHSRGVYGAVRSLTAAKVRVDNERYLAELFPGKEFAMLLRVPVVAAKTLSPDFQDPGTRLYEWSPDRGATRSHGRLLKPVEAS